MNIIDWQRQGVKLLTLSREVDYILSAILGLSRTELYINDSQLVDQERGRAISQALEKRLSGMPIQYILEEVEFFSLPFILKPGVFIPRPETELLVEEALKIIASSSPSSFHDLIPRSSRRTESILDFCTGCGNIALSLAKNIPCKIIATDLSPLSIEVAKENAIRLGLSDRVKFLQGDLFAPLSSLQSGMSFSLIISNPPYITGKEWENLPGEVKYYEPCEALFGGEDGLDFYKRISYDAKIYIKEGGYLLLEVGPAREVVSILKKDGWQDIKIIKDYNNRDRIISCRS